MARVTFASETLTLGVSVDNVDIERTDGAIDELLARPISLWDRVRTSLIRRRCLGPVVNGSSALGRDEEFVRGRGFVPLTWLVVEFWSGGRFGVECWVEPSGRFVLEVAHPIQGEPVIGRGRRALAAYFTDGASLVMWHDDKYLAQLETPTRTSLVSSGDLAQDVEVFVGRMNELLAEGKKLMSVWDVKSMCRRYEVYDRFMEAEGTRRGQVTTAKQNVIKFLSLQIPIYLLLVAALTWSWALLVWAVSLVVIRLITRRLRVVRLKPAGATVVGST